MVSQPVRWSSFDTELANVTFAVTIAAILGIPQRLRAFPSAEILGGQAIVANRERRRQLVQHDWDAHYAAGETPWDTDGPEPALVELLEAGRLPAGRALDVGCGTGIHARWLASHGYRVVGVDISRLAIERAAVGAPDGSIELLQLDFLIEQPPGGPFDLVFDRGCFHVFDDPRDQRRFVERVAECLAPAGLWVSLIGSTEGPPRDHGPPRRTARDIASAVEPSLAVGQLRAIEFDSGLPSRTCAWLLLAHRRVEPAQPSTA